MSTRFASPGSTTPRPGGIRINYTEVAEGFNPEVGFLTRKGFRKPGAFVMYRIRPKDHVGPAGTATAHLL